MEHQVHELCNLKVVDRHDRFVVSRYDQVALVCRHTLQVPSRNAVHPGPQEGGSLRGGVHQLRAYEACPGEVRFGQIRVAEIHPRQVRPGQRRSG